MKKYIIFLLLILFSCQKDELLIGPDVPREDLVFAVSESSVVDGQTLFFEVSSETQHTFVIYDTETKSVVGKQSILPTLGMNTIVLYTKALPKKTLELILYQDSTEYKKTNIIIQ